MIDPKYFDPRRYFAFARRKYIDLFYTETVSRQAVEAAQAEAFAGVGLDYAAAVRRLDEMLAAMGLPPYDESDGMASQHWTLFAGIAAASPVRDILEIGTFNARGTLVLSRLFPDSRIVTLDLDDASPHFNDSYGRNDIAFREAHIRERTANLARCPNATFLPANSFHMPKHLAGRRFDLIWVDGSHDYPAIAWDMFHALHSLNPDGWLLADDVFRHPKARWLPYANDGHDLIRYLAVDGIVAPRFVAKRVQETRINRIREKHILVLRQDG